ncbi:MAG: hypothetical protein Q8P01_02920 [bacterium]|nr:hypothetical protein [bacterium]
MVIIAVVFLFSRIAYYLLGISMTIGGWLLNQSFLKTDLLQSIFYLHIQPPMMNLLYGILMKFFGDYWLMYAHIIFIALGLCLSISLFLLMRRLGVSPSWSLFFSMLFIISPPSILYENYFSYIYPSATMLCVAALFLHKFITVWKWKNGCIFFFLLTALILTSSFFHPIWFFAIVVLFITLFSNRRTMILKLAAVPFLIVLLWYGKNIYLFGTTAGSSWLGMNLAKTTIESFSQVEREKLAQGGIISALSLRAVANPSSKFQNLVSTAKTGIKVLDEKINDSGAQLNHLSYIPISKQLLKDSLRVIAWDPERYLRKAVAPAFYIYFLPASRFNFVRDNNGKISLYSRIFDNVVYGGFRHTAGLGMSIRNVLDLGFFIIAAYVIVFLSATKELYDYFIKHNRAEFTPAYITTLLFILGSVTYVMIISNLLELGENMKYRFMTDPIFFVFLIVILYKMKKNRFNFLKKRF